jgi:hypothetical protein
MIFYLIILVICLVILIFNCIYSYCTKKENYDIINVDYNTLYFNNRGLAQLCDKKLDIVESDNDNNFNIKSFENIKDNDIIFLTTDLFKNFIDSINLVNHVIIVLSCSDCGFPVEYSNRHEYNYINYINNNNFIKKIYCGNYDLNYKHNKIECLPLGIDYHTLSYSRSPIEQENDLKDIVSKSKNFDNRLNRTFSFFHFSMHEKNRVTDRYNAKAVLDTKNFNDYQKNRMSRIDTWNKMINYKWIISPHGNGLDTHRTYEAIALGCIPVVKSSSLDQIYKNMPIIILDNWEDISLDILEKKTIEANKKSRDTILLEYWFKIIKSS